MSTKSIKRLHLELLPNVISRLVSHHWASRNSIGRNSILFYTRFSMSGYLRLGAVVISCRQSLKLLFLLHFSINVFPLLLRLLCMLPLRKYLMLMHQVHANVLFTHCLSCMHICNIQSKIFVFYTMFLNQAGVV